MPFDEGELERLADRVIEKMIERQGSVQPRLLSIPAAAIYLGRTVSAVKHLVERGKLPVVKLDDKIQIDRQVLDRILSRHAEGAA